MSPRAPVEPARFRHTALIHESDDEFLDVVVPFLRDGLAAGEPTLLSVPPPRCRLVRDALDDPTDLIVLGNGEHYARPLDVLQANHELFTRHAADGTQPVRIVGEIPNPGTGASWDGWARYESAINHLFATLPVATLCAYDRRTTPHEVLSDVERTHPYVRTAGDGDRPNPRYTEPAGFLSRRADARVDPVEETRPDVELIDPSEAQARQVAARLGRTGRLAGDTLDDLVLAVSEVVSNARVHGEPETRLRGWATPDRVVVAVRDRGTGPEDPFVGFLPRERRGLHAGFGLWLANKLCARVTLERGADGFTVHLVSGTPHEPDG